MRYVLLIMAIVLNASANILTKIGASKLGILKNLPIVSSTIKFLTNYYLLGGLILFALNIVFYILALSKINLSIAYPVMTSGGFLIISLFSIFYLKESLTSLQILGIILIAIGITLIAYNIK
ncbi:hypothetical protein HZC20_03180 [Candidatus Peregrinibacteria bacterium]|nr:hypothetical protein [Candidatus Peregrinibacteria bacterium]